MCADDAFTQEMMNTKYADAGIVGVSFFVEGKWQTVFVDEYFPCRHNGKKVRVSTEMSIFVVFALQLTIFG